MKPLRVMVFELNQTCETCEGLTDKILEAIDERKRAERAVHRRIAGYL
jgi:hypothetical protein